MKLIALIKEIKKILTQITNMKSTGNKEIHFLLFLRKIFILKLFVKGIFQIKKDA